MLSLVVLSIALFTATNVDGLFLLTAFYADPAYRSPDIVVGQYVAMAALFAASLAASRAAQVFPPALIGWLGLVPIALGAKKLWDLRKPGPPRVGAGPARGGLGRALVVAAVGIANGGDNLGAYTPQFAIHSGPQIVVMGLVFGVLTGLWCLLARAVLAHPAIGRAARAYGHRLVPWALIALGLWTLVQAGVL